MKIIPSPKTLELHEEEFFFSSTLKSKYNSENLDESLIVKLFNKFTHTCSFLELTKNSDMPEYSMIFGEYEGVCKEPVGNIQYTISIEKGGACIKGRDRISMLHGYYTLLQMLRTHNLTEGMESFSLKCGFVEDWTDVKFRGIDLCVFPETSLEFLRKAMKLCAFYKYSHVVLRFWGSLKFDSLKELAWENAYTKEQVAPIINEARAMGIEVIPMFNHLGHASQARERYAKHVVLDQNPKLAMLFEDDGWTWCLSNPKTHELLRNLRRELIELCGEGEYFYLGFDEGYSFATCPKCEKLNKQDMFVEYLNGLAEELKAQGRRGMICGDMFLDKEKWQPPIWPTGRKEHGLFNCMDRLSKDIIIKDWQYEVCDGIAESTAFFIEKGFETITSPWDKCGNINSMVETAIQNDAMGVIATTWDTLSEHLWLIGYCASKMWNCADLNGADFETNKNDMQIKTAEVIRKLTDKYTGYENAGWRRNEV